VTKVDYNFQGTFPVTIDPKNRLLVPAKLRSQLAKDRDLGFVVNTSTTRQKRIWLIPSSYYPRVVAAARKAAVTDADKKFVAYHYSAGAVEVEFDTQARILLPQHMLKRTGTGRDIVILGMTNYLEIWNEADWNEQSEQLAQQADGAVAMDHPLMDKLAMEDADKIELMGGGPGNGQVTF
jgi:MraZ protein